MRTWEQQVNAWYLSDNQCLASSPGRARPHRHFSSSHCKQSATTMDHVPSQNLFELFYEMSGLYRVVEQVSWKLKQGRPRWECTCAWMWLPSCFSFWCAFVGTVRKREEGEGGGRNGEGWREGRGGGDLATRLGLWPSPRSFWCVFVGHITTGVIIQTRWSG